MYIYNVLTRELVLAHRKARGECDLRPVATVSGEGFGQRKG